MQNTVRYMRFGKGADCAAVAMLVNEALSVLLKDASDYLLITKRLLYLLYHWILFNMQSSDSILNVCVNKLDSQALLFWSNLIHVCFCLCACSVKCCSPLSFSALWATAQAFKTVAMETLMSVNHTGQR